MIQSAPVSPIEFPHKGIEVWTNQHGIRIFRLHYSADPDKDKAWAEAQRKAMTNPADYLQEFEINFSAKLGTLIYQLHDEASLERSFPIPGDWTRYFALDPHPVVPHACLWVAVDRFGDAWVYRELWPSRIYGIPGTAPEDDHRFSIKEYVETIQWLEGPENPENTHLKSKSGELVGEKIYRRVIDYAARAMGKGMSDEDPDYNFQRKYEDLAGWSFDDSIKDHQAGYEAVNEWLKPRDVEQRDGTFKPKSRLHIFSDRCPELIHQLKNNRFQQLTPTLAERQDPTGKPMAKRNHLTDDLRYLCMAGLEYVPQRTMKSNWKPITKGIAY
ncbi:MAG: hypothetical protein JO356_01150 [Acidobacteria bacterium]|nr:hypothetical protein [Acidobacteriota bacterium]